MSRRRCVFNAELQKKYSFFNKSATNDSEIHCTVCDSTINISSDGKTGIERHIGSSKHQKTLNSKATSHTVTKFFQTPINYKIAAYEGLWSYHMVHSNQSFRSADCSSKNFRECFDYHSARTKSEAIITNVLAPFALDEVKKDLASVNYITLTTDASNRKNVKMMPVMARYFVPTVGVSIKMLEFSSVKGETAVIISNLIKNAAVKFNVKEKIIGFSADNCPANFGSASRGGENNAYYLLKEWKPKLIEIGCGCHIVHNASKTACEYIIVKIY